MNIKDFWGELGPTPELSAGAIYGILQRRMATFKGFLEIEQDKGLLSWPIDIRTPRGQDQLRLLFWRCLEEYSEAIAAKEQEHVLEELIDSFNYISAAYWSVYEPRLDGFWVVLDNPRVRADPTHYRLGMMADTLATVTDQFRNRAWMVNSQDTYFAGMEAFQSACAIVITDILKCFQDWNEFWRYFTAKDMVLQFRLRSRY